MQLDFLRVRFEFTARERLAFPPGTAANTLRGAFGAISGQAAMAPPFPRPAGLADPPRPFVFRARHLDGVTIPPGASFYFDLHLFSLDPALLTTFIDAFRAITREGLGPARAKAELHPVRCVTPVSLDLARSAQACHKIRVDFLSPTELKHAGQVANQPLFPVLFARARDRISALRGLYGPGPLAISFKAMAERAAVVRTTSCEIRRIETSRRSSRTGQTHSIGGFIGFAEYEGELAEFLPYLEAARWTGVGRHAVWGNGEIATLPAAQNQP